MKPLTELEERLLSLVSNLNIEGVSLVETGVEEENEVSNVVATNDTPILVLTDDNSMVIYFLDKC